MNHEDGLLKSGSSITKNSVPPDANGSEAAISQTVTSNSSVPPDANGSEAAISQAVTSNSSVPPDANGSEATMSQAVTSSSSVPPDANLTDAATLLAVDLTKAIEKLGETLSLALDVSGNLTLSQMIFGIFIVVTGAFSAYAFNYLHWRIVEKKRKNSGVRSALTTLISDLESIAVKYWLRDYKEEDELEIHEAEISIKIKIQLISNYSHLVADLLDSKNSAESKRKLTDFPLNIYDLATGDGFESVSKRSSKSKAMKISKSCLEIKAIILTLDSCD